MGIISKVLSFLHTEENSDKVTEVTVDPGGGANVSGIQYSPVGEDSQPLKGDFAVSVRIPGTGVSVVVGYLDSKNEQKSGAAEKRIYARDSGGDSVVELWLKNDGSAKLCNDNGAVELKADGDVDIGEGANLKAIITEEIINVLQTVTLPVSGAVAGPYPIGSFTGTTTTKTKAV